MFFIIYNIPGMIALIISVVLGVFLEKLVPQSLSNLQNFCFTVPLLVVGYIFEMLEMRPRLYKIPVYIIGAISTIVLAFVELGPLQFMLAVVLLLLFVLLLMVVHELKAWGEAKASLNEYFQIGDTHQEMHEMMLMKSLFQNKFTPARQAYVEHNKVVLHHLLHDKAVHLTLPELQLLNQTYHQLKGGQNVVKYGWRLNYIKEMRSKLDALKESRSIGNMRIGA
jgi:hypothetical protein